MTAGSQTPDVDALLELMFRLGRAYPHRSKISTT